MNFLTITSQLMTTTSLVLLAIFLLLSVKLRKEIGLMYLKPIKGKSYYTPGVHKTWLINNSIIFLVLLTFVSLKSYVFYHEAETKALEPPKVVEVVKPKTQLNPVVFYYCLDAGRGKDGAKADVIKACKDAATIELAQDNVKYTISKRDIVF